MGQIAFLIGAGRSGTTLLRVMLAGHPGLFAPPELRLAPFRTMADRAAWLARHEPWQAEGLRRTLMAVLATDVVGAVAAEADLATLPTAEVYRFLLDRIGGRHLVDKCPRLASDPAAMARVRDAFPDAPFIALVRHPVSVINSLRTMRRSELLLGGLRAEDYWTATNRDLVTFLDTLPEQRRLVVRFEELVTTPEPVLRRVCAHLGVDFDPAVLDPYAGERLIDGPPGARALGDTGLRRRTHVDPALADAWKAGIEPAALTPELRRVAGRLGYALDVPSTAAADAAADLIALFADLPRRIEPLAASTPDDVLTLASIVGQGLVAGRPRREILAALDRPLDAWRAAGRTRHNTLTPSDALFPAAPPYRSWAAFLRFDPDERAMLSGSEATVTSADRWMRESPPIRLEGDFRICVGAGGDLDPVLPCWLVVRATRAPTLDIERA